ncbi:ATP-dependent protease ATPase subunit HslU [Pseudobythopirellula maris]|uniref:ATP-dependent protease ATPase subunit HslU n=1 Tax=Pseudobythopirellula maris TaxID=2527991 RepID=A0A5C5ZTJ7_9BACT|nr:ATP-dependent protease ATPase subunit HslU [Pseudobythopirellula maris]TWT90161.1 ATP-dependent protease ATPase subunit HslU [Pseudobythopirellula maris]
MRDLTPKQIVEELDRHIVGQADAKRAVAVAVRNRWRRQQLDDELRKEVSPKNILLIGPTGVGKTEISRRLATLTGAPFIKVEASKYTEVGYYGRDVESMIRDLVENAIGLVRTSEKERVEEEAHRKVDERILDLLVPAPASIDVGPGADDPAESHKRTREKMRAMLVGGELEDRKVEITVERKAQAMMIPGMGGPGGGDSMDIDLQGMIEKMLPKQVNRRELPVSEAREVLFEQACESLINAEQVNAKAIELAQDLGIVFLDEIDKVVATEGGKGADVSRQGVQRDLLPIVEGTTVQTRYGYVKTDHILFVAAGAFHKVSPSDLMPELQGRFPIRVELSDLTKEDFVRILTEPKGSLTKQYQALLGTERVEIEFDDSAIEALAEYAFEVNQSMQNIGARRLNTMMERLLDELSYEAPEMNGGRVPINAAYVKERLEAVTKDEDLSRYIL